VTASDLLLLAALAPVAAWACFSLAVALPAFGAALCWLCWAWLMAAFALPVLGIVRLLR
jgi:hypothetical protein